MTKSTYRRLEQGAFKYVDLDDVAVVAEVLGTNLEVLMTEAVQAVNEANAANDNPAADSFGSALGF
ncbi:hypothetical protein [Nocardia sp. NPDC049707]|uniref:hypothetical protein n=1 Tax=Nocardia sp. NPDC049707 TaxID=3154735 RepID=UPI003439D94C